MITSYTTIVCDQSQEVDMDTIQLPKLQPYSDFASCYAVFLHTLFLFHLPITTISILQKENWGQEKSSNFPKVVSDRIGIETQFCLMLSPSSKTSSSTRSPYQVHGHQGSLARDSAVVRLQGDAGDKLTEEAYG